MDKIKTFFRLLKRIHFWLICVLLLVSGLAAWLLSVSDLDKKRDSRVSDINGLYQKVTTISSTAPHPNEDVSAGMAQLLDQTRTEIREAWTEKFSQQTEILQWPEELNDRFKKVVEPLRPIEKYVPFPLPPEDEKLRMRDRENFNNFYVKRQLPKLAKQIGARWVASLEGRGGIYGGGGGFSEGFGGEMEMGGLGSGANPEEDAERVIVRWNPENQQQIFQEHFLWTTENMDADSEADAQPNTLEILYAQEDIWVLRALMNIIQRTNGDANARHHAAIKSIDYIRIGAEAVKGSGRVTRIGGDGGGFDEGGFDGGMGEDYGDGGFGEGMGGEGMFGEGMGMGGGMMKDPAEGRYVDAEYVPLSAEKLRSVMSASEELAPEDAYLAVAKRMPVRMRFSMDQRAIHRLLVECANNELVLEVRQVRVNPEEEDPNALPGGFGGFGGGEMGGMGHMEGEFGGMEGEMGGFGGGFGAPKRAKVEKAETNRQFPFDTPVEIYGIIYIYNPVDEAVLGSGDAADEEATEDLAAR